MCYLFCDPILAAGLGGWMFVAMIVMMFVGWFMNLLSKKNQPAAARRARRREPAGRQEDPLQSEIDDFLAEVGDGRRPSPAEPVLIEVVPEEPRRPRRRPQSRPRPKQSRPVEQPAQMLSERHLESDVAASSDLGGGLRKHVSEYMADDAIDQQVEQDLNHAIASDWAKRERLTTGAGDVEFEVTESDLAQVEPNQIVAMLRNPASIRQAIIVSEVLARPKCLR